MGFWQNRRLSLLYTALWWSMTQLVFSVLTSKRTKSQKLLHTLTEQLRSFTSLKMSQILGEENPGNFLNLKVFIK